MKTKLSTLVDDLQMMSDSAESFLDKETGEIYYVSEDDRFALNYDDGEPPQWQKEHLEIIKPILEDFDLQRYIWLPSKYDLNEYSVMERFITSLSNSRAQETLWNSIKGRGAFRRFKDSVLRLGLSDQWYHYRDAAIKEFAIQWCEENGISYVDDTKE